MSRSPGVDDLLAKWPRDDYGSLDLAYSPFRLMAPPRRVSLVACLMLLLVGR